MDENTARFLHDELMYRLLIKRDNKTTTEQVEEELAEAMADLWYDMSKQDMDEVNALCKQHVNNYEFTELWLKKVDDGTKSI